MNGDSKLPTVKDLEVQKQLKIELQDNKNKSKFENMTAALIGRLLGLQVTVAKSGFQHGGDAGSAGRQERRFRIECKKYCDTTSLSDRELLGEIDQALARDESLEAWILAATRTVPEQLAQDLVQKGENIGVPVVILDWNDHQITPLAALCAFYPDIVEMELSKKAGMLSRELQPVSAQVIEMLHRDLQSWCLGFELLRARSHYILDSIWNSPRESHAKLGHDSAGGAQTNKVKRKSVNESLCSWWKGPAQTDAPAAVVGWDGVGKTWATLDWLVDRKEEQPVVLIVPSSSAAMLSCVSESSIKRFMADLLYEITDVRDSRHWQRRLDLLLTRPIDEGPILTVFFDGLNQEPSVNWLLLLKVLQSESFSGRVRVIVSTRNHYFENKLSKLRGLIEPAVQVVVDVYDTSPGGELDQMLAFEGLTQVDLHSELIELARTPRMFKLVVRFRDRVIEAGQVTVHRLLWEYGRDTFGERAGKSFSETEWRSWLQKIAQKCRDGIQEFSIKSLGELASRPDLSESEVSARLSDIIDGRFARPCPSGNMQLTPTVVAHALGAALLTYLDSLSEQTSEVLDSKLLQWLDPISGFDQRAEILRAAVSIQVERDLPTASPLTRVLVTEWLQTQNVTESHLRELAILAPNLIDALLYAVEHSDSHSHVSARLWAVNALRAIPRTQTSSLTTIVTRLCHWFGIVSREAIIRMNSSPEFDKRLLDRFRNLIGKDSTGLIVALGFELELVDWNDTSLQVIAPSIIEGFPLAQAISIFEVAAVVLAIRGRSEGWSGLRWLCLLNETDPDETVAALRKLSREIRHRTLEQDIHPDLSARVAALLLWLTGQEIDENAAVSIDPNIESRPDYKSEYLQQPSRSLRFPLERRHAEIALKDKELTILKRIAKTKDLWLDPSFEPSISFANEVREMASNFNIDTLSHNRGYTIEDHTFEELELVLARCAPEILTDLVRLRMQSVNLEDDGSRYWNAIYSANHLLIARKAEAETARILRISGKEDGEKRDSFIASQLLLIELRNLDPKDQIDECICADLNFIPTFLEAVLLPPTPNDVDILIDRYSAKTTKQQHDLLILLSFHEIKLSDKSWSWIEHFLGDEDPNIRGISFKILYQANSLYFGQRLEADSWFWSPDEHVYVNHYGTGALIKATRALPFDHVASRLVPTCISQRNIA